MAPVVLVLGSMAVQVTSALIRKQLMKYGFRVASNYKKYSNVTKVTSKNSANVLNKAKNLGQKLGKIKPTPTSPGGGKAVKLTDAMKKTARNAQKVSGKEFGKRKLSDFGRVGPKLEVASGNKKGNLIAAALTTLSPSSTKDTSVASAPLTKYEKKKIRETPVRKAPKKNTTGPKQPGFSRLGPKSEKKSNVNKPTKEQGFTAQVEATKLKTPALEAGFTGDKAPPTSVLKKAAPMLRPKARPETVKKAKKELSSFGKKFKSERAKGEYSFPFKGKEYTTRYKEESVAEHKKKFPKKK